MNKTILGLALLTAATLLAIPGDFNGNGMLDVGDLGRLEYFASEHLYDPGADLNFDEVIDKNDILLLFEAVTQGKPLPVMLYRERIQRYQENIHISESGLTVDIPGTCNASPLLTFATIDPLPDFDVELGNTKISPPVILYNMPGRPDIETATFTLEVPEEHNEAAGPPMLLVGYYLPDRLQKEPPKWKYMGYPAMEEFNVTYASRKLTWTPDFALTEGFESTPIALAVIYTTESPTRSSASNSEDPPQTRDGSHDFEFLENTTAFTGFHTYGTKNFMFQLMVDAPVGKVREMARDFEKAFELIGKQGMPQNFVYKWGAIRIRVNVIKNPPPPKKGEEDKSQNAECNRTGYLSAPFIETPLGVLTASQRAETCCHELFHYHQFYYACHSSALFLDEMVGSWSEYLISPMGEYHQPNNCTFSRAPINGLYMKSWTDNFYVNFYHLFAAQHAGDHGYNLHFFAQWLVNVKYPGKQIWPAVFSSSAYLNGDGIGALKAGIKAMNPKHTLAENYHEFMYYYFDDNKPGISRKEKGFQNFCKGYPQDGIDRFEETGLVTKIKKVEDMFKPENTSHTFSVQNYGGATWALQYYLPWLFLEDYSNAVFTFSLPRNTSISIKEYSFFAYVKATNNHELKPLNLATFDTESNTATLVIPLEDLAIKPDDARVTNKSFFNWIGLTAVLASENLSEDNRSGLTMSVSYDGPIVLKDLMATMPGYYDPQGLMKTGMDLMVTPQGNLGLQYIGREDFNTASSGQHIKFTSGHATLTRPAITQETEITLNLTAAIRNLTSELTLSGKETPEFTGRFKLRIFRGETGVDAGIPIAWSIEGDNGQYDNESVLSIQRLAAVAPSKRSNFTIRFKVAPPPAGNASCNYSIAIYPIFNIIESNNFSEERECLSGGFSIQVPAAPKKPSQQ